LREVGGVGQQALLTCAARSSGTASAPQAIAMAYLAAGGTPLQGETSGAEPAFFGDQATVGSPTRFGVLASIPAQFEGDGPWVALGSTAPQGPLAIVYRAPAGCADCFKSTVEALHPCGAQSPRDVHAGALAALLFQRCVLGFSEPLGAVQLGDDET